MNSSTGTNSYVVPVILWNRLQEELKHLKENVAASAAAAAKSQAGGAIAGVDRDGNVRMNELMHTMAVQQSLQQSPKVEFVKYADKMVKQVMSDPSLTPDERVRFMTNYATSFQDQKAMAQKGLTPAVAPAPGPAPAPAPGPAPGPAPALIPGPGSVVGTTPAWSLPAGPSGVKLGSGSVTPKGTGTGPGPGRGRGRGYTGKGKTPLKRQIHFGNVPGTSTPLNNLRPQQVKQLKKLDNLIQAIDQKSKNIDQDNSLTPAQKRVKQGVLTRGRTKYKVMRNDILNS